MNKKILIVDGSSLFFRAFYALPLLKTKRGIYTNAIYGFISMLENAIEKVDPQYIVTCFDMKGKTFRTDIYDDYKGNRQKTPSELEQQFPIVREILKAMNIKALESPIYEADDIAGTIASLANENDIEAILLTGDKDYFQLANKNTKILFTKKGITELDIVTEDSIEKSYQINPNQLIDIKGLMGDQSDNIPGVPGIGEKTALKLIHQFSSMENIYDNLDEVSGKKLKENLEENKAQAFMSKKLGAIVKNVPLDEEIEDFKRVEYDYDTLTNMYREYEFNTLIKRLPDQYQKEEFVEVNDNFLEYEEKSIDDLISAIKKKNSFSFKFITDGKIYEEVFPSYLAIKTKDDKVNFISLENQDTIKSFKEVFEDKSIEKLGHELKEDIMILKYYNIELNNFIHDSKIAEYLLNATQSNYDIDNLSNIYFNYSYKSEEDLLGKGVKKKNFSDIEEDELKKYYSFILNSVYKLYEKQIEKIKDYGMENLYYEVELPLVEVLSSMELIGVNIKSEILDEIGDDLDKRIEDLKEKIYKESGEEFNINSTKKLSEILFEKMNLPVIKKTKTGYSTSAEVLEKLVPKAEIASYILDYRQFK